MAKAMLCKGCEKSQLQPAGRVCEAVVGGVFVRKKQMGAKWLRPHMTMSHTHTHKQHTHTHTNSTHKQHTHTQTRHDTKKAEKKAMNI